MSVHEVQWGFSQCLYNVEMTILGPKGAHGNLYVMLYMPAASNSSMLIRNTLRKGMPSGLYLAKASHIPAYIDTLTAGVAELMTLCLSTVCDEPMHLVL